MTGPVAVDVLVVEDDPDLRAAVVAMLVFASHSVAQAADGLDALAWLTSTPTLPRLVLMDLMMPRMDGWELLRTIKADARLAQVPIVVMTASPQDGVGADVVLRKPVRLRLLLSTVQPLVARDHDEPL